MLPSWFLLAAVCAAAYALEGVWVKRLRGRFRPEFLGWVAATLTLPVLGTALYLQGWPEIKPGFYFALAMTVLGNTVGIICFFRALSLGELSVVYPLLALSPAWMLLSTRLITGEFPSRAGLAGVLLCTGGCYALGLDKGGLLSPLRNLWNDAGGRYALLTSVIWSVTSNFDKKAVETSSAMFYPAAHGIGLSLSLYLLTVRRCTDEFRLLASWDGAWRIGVLTLIICVLVVSQFFAVDLAQATYVIAVKRSGMVLAVLLGWLLYKEPYGPRRLGLSLLVLAGLLLMLK
ncbi:MAG: EamA family transporter [Elusimicrobiota bacterium]